MEEKEATRTCGQCHRDVAEANFSLHETHCRRFLCVCPDCEEAVPKDQLDQHREEQHTLVRCSKCNKKMERRHLSDHESDECVERPQSCQYCELELPWKELDEHHVVCGSRTELCRECGRYVTLRDQPGHSLTCSATDDGSSPLQTTSNPKADNTTEKITVTCKRCTASFPAEDRDKHELNCAPTTKFDDVEDKPEEEEGEDEDYSFKRGGALWLNSTYKSNSMSHRASNGPWDDGGDPDQISTCPYCHLALPLRTLLWHKRKCQIHVIMK